jgi:hypothetical protein
MQRPLTLLKQRRISMTILPLLLLPMMSPERQPKARRMTHPLHPLSPLKSRQLIRRQVTRHQRIRLPPIYR